MKPMFARRNVLALAQVVCATALVNVLTGFLLYTSAAMTSAHFSSAMAETAKPIRIVAFGDSLSAGYGLRQSQAFPAQLQKELKARGHNVIVANAGVSGDTTAAGLARLAWAIGDDADAVILEFGANDALRGIDPKVTRENMQKILSKLADRRIPVLLTGMRSPTNWGETYSDDFDAIFPDLAREHSLIFYPFFLEGVVLDAKLNQDDGMHPNAKGVAAIVHAILPSVEKLITKAEAQRAAASKS
jgi:acyl-CoA thioesterase-1